MDCYLLMDGLTASVAVVLVVVGSLFVLVEDSMETEERGQVGDTCSGKRVARLVGGIQELPFGG
jgi:hypothetical protein